MNRQRFLIRGLLESRVRMLRKEAIKQAFQHALFGDSRTERVTVGGEFQVVFDPQAYAPNADYAGRYGDYDFLIVEYKGAQGWTDAQDDRDIGNLWAELSGGNCRFVMVRDRRWAQIEAAMAP